MPPKFSRPLSERLVFAHIILKVNRQFSYKELKWANFDKFFVFKAFRGF